jgi:hypothetical protein
MPQSIQVVKSIQYQSVPLLFLPGPGWIQATGQASTQSATPSQVSVTIVCGKGFPPRILNITLPLFPSSVLALSTMTMLKKPRLSMFRLSITLVLVLTEGFFTFIKAEESPASSKITFDLSTLSETGLIGQETDVRERSATASRSLAYEFCIPAHPQAAAEVISIDPSLRVYPNSRGRIGCTADRYLCIGETHTEKWREKLLKLANLDYIAKIQASHAE